MDPPRDIASAHPQTISDEAVANPLEPSVVESPSPLFALISSASDAGIASTFSICSFACSGCAAGRSILLITGMMVRL